MKNKEVSVRVMMTLMCVSVCVEEKHEEAEKRDAFDDFFLLFRVSVAAMNCTHTDDMKKCKFNLHFVTCPICSRYVEIERVHIKCAGGNTTQ